MVEIDWKQFSRVFDTFSSEQYAAIMHNFYTWIVDVLDEDDRDPAHFLELGSGTGLFAEKMIGWYPDAVFDLVDNNPHMLEVARRRFADSPTARIHELAVEPFLELQPPESADVAIYCRSWYALAEPEQAAVSTMRVLRPGGKVFIFDFTRPIDVDALDSVYREREPTRWPACKAAYDEFNEGVAAGRYRLYSRESMESLWNSVGGEMSAYVSFEPDKPSHQMCVTRR